MVSAKNGLALCGMDDAGEMSSWYVFAALGLYPFSPAEDSYIVTVPIFNEINWKMPSGKTLSITKTGTSRILKEIKLNGKKINGYLVTHEQMKDGGEIEVVTE
ncbi:MAG: glycoside hydrolase family 92 protein [Chitinophagaceae bacterium]|nr:glycoside hydrolase family 92 protein [Chitinophagaceae bacterium]